MRDAKARGYLARKDQRSRVGRSVNWLDGSGAIWHWSAPATVKAHLATIRERVWKALSRR